MSSAREPTYSNDAPYRASDWRALINTLTAGKPYNRIYIDLLGKKKETQNTYSIIPEKKSTYNPCQVPMYMSHVFAVCPQEEHGGKNVGTDRK